LQDHGINQVVHIVINEWLKPPIYNNR